MTEQTAQQQCSTTGVSKRLPASQPRCQALIAAGWALVLRGTQATSHALPRIASFSPPPPPPSSRAHALSAMAKPGGAPTPSARDVVADRTNISKAVAGGALAITSAAKQLLLPAHAACAHRQRAQTAARCSTCAPQGQRGRGAGKGGRGCGGASSTAQAARRRQAPGRGGQHHHRPLTLRTQRARAQRACTSGETARLGGGAWGYPRDRPSSDRRWTRQRAVSLPALKP